MSLPKTLSLPSPSTTLGVGEERKPPLIIIIGPTAVGKTEIAIQLAERLNGEIVSADSRLFYRGMDIGTAKPSAAERERAPHHLIDIADPDEVWSLAVFQRAAHEVIRAIHTRKRLPFLVGGTGQYIRAVTQGWQPPPQAPNACLRNVLERMAEQYGSKWLYERLKTLDPAAADEIDTRNVRRTVRALEVIFGTGRRFSEQRGRSESPYHLLTIGLHRSRPELYARIDARIEAMFAAGFIEEVKSLLGKGYSHTLLTLSAIGYRECVAVIKSRMTLEEAKVQMKRLTRVFVRRQANWFRKSDPQIHWFEAGETGIKDKIEAFIRAWLKG